MASTVVVVGGGLSGLAAARRLVLDGLDDVVVVEARDEPGGKCVQHVVDGHTIEAGGAWTGPTQRPIKELAAAYGIGTYPVEVSGGQLMRFADGVVDYRAPDDWGVSEHAQAELERALAQLQQLCDGVPADRPWDAPDADDLDATTVEAWIRGQTEDPEARSMLAHYFETTTVAPRQLSLLSVLAFIRSTGGVEELESEGEELFEGGASQIGRHLAEELGERVRVGWPVSEISWRDGTAEVMGPKGILTAPRVIVAMSPADARRIQYRPGLTTKRRLLHTGWITGSVLKLNVVYARPFWREPSGARPAITGWVSNESGCPSAIVDATPADGHVGILVAFTPLLGERERFTVSHDVLDDPAARTRLVLENLVRMYGPEAADPLAVHEMDWSREPYIDGCLGFAPPGLLTHCGEALREPVGPIHWAGADLADEWINHLSGAVQSGERAAREVAAALATAG